MKKWLINIISSTALVMISVTANAADLIQVFQQAYVNDPTFQAALATYEANKQNTPIARSSLLPQLIGAASTQYNHVINKTTPRFRRGSKFNFNSNGYELDLSQTVFNMAQWANLKSARASVKAANAIFNAAFQNLESRVAESYFNVLDAEDNLRFIEAQKAAIYRQLDQAQQQFKVGLIAITSVYQSQAAYDNVVAEEIAAQNDIINRREDLRAITGRYYDHLAGLRGEVPLVTPQPSNVDLWVDMGVKQNWTLVASRYSAEEARQQINVQRAGHLPIVNGFGELDRQRSGTSPAGQINTYQNAFGVEVQLPIYQGGFVTASTKQAAYNWQASVDNQELAYRNAVNLTRQSYNNVIAGISKIKADKQAIISNKASLESTIEAYKVGTQTMLDVLNSQQELFNTLRGYATDQYDYINSLVSLKEAAGTLNINDLQEINTWLTQNRPSYAFISTNSLQRGAARKVNTNLLTPSSSSGSPSNSNIKKQEKEFEKIISPTTPNSTTSKKATKKKVVKKVVKTKHS